MKYSACLEMLFDGIPFYERFDTAKSCGADAVEFYNPADYDANKIARESAKAGLPVAICGIHNGFTYRLDSDINMVLENIRKTIEFGKEIGCSTFTGHVGTGQYVFEEERQKTVDNLKRIAELCEKENVIIAVEIINSLYESPGYFFDTTSFSAEILDEVGSDSIRLLYDLYHVQLMEGNLINNIRRFSHYIAHFHSAGVPDRRELFAGEVDYRNVVKAIEQTGYAGYMGLEYSPSVNCIQSVKQVLDYLNG